MLGVTIGIGEGWGDVARRAAERMSRMTGLECMVIEKNEFGLAHPSWLKCHVLDLFPKHEEFLVFDADILPLRPWSPDHLFRMMGRRFCAVPEDNSPTILVECTNYRLPFPDWYVNGGLAMFGREHAPIWKAVLGYHPKYGSWLEQTALNEAIRRGAHEVARLPRFYNQLLHGRLSQAAAVAHDCVNLHIDSMGGHVEELVRLQEAFFK